ncbi:hypothetical protein GGX14DRAFT_451396 [Mycena pura]|uniref:Uncharacterized protein n=1 Tax=Mycena pura TaxID=153505 RepID=A0AAD6YAE6_9AGAR|nr:hypothetical protein GGX14DRAFT_451396 [Mycena pura]
MDRLHVIWLCIQIPTAGGRFLKAASASEVPVTIVFTQFDKLCRSIFCRRLPHEERNSAICEERAEEKFKELRYVSKKLSRFFARDQRLCSARTSGLTEGVHAKPDRNSLDDLHNSVRLVEDCFPGDTVLVSVMAQRASVKTKIDDAFG